MMEKQYTILVVDDETDILESVFFELQLEGFNVLKASGGKEAWKIFSDEKTIDLVITDVRMPEGDGVELLERLKENSPEHPAVLFITGHNDISDKESKEKGAQSIIAKPFKISRLMSEIKKCPDDEEKS